MNKFSFVSFVVVAVILGVCLFYGVRNSSALLNADQYSYLVFAKALAKGSLYQEYEPYRLFADRVRRGDTVFLHYGTRNVRDGKIYSGLPIGFPLLLALALRLGGVPAAVNLNAIVLLLFVVVYFLTVREFFGDSPERDFIALLSTLLVLSVDGNIIPRYSLLMMRDLPSITFFWLCILFLLRSRRVDGWGRAAFIFLSALALGFSSTIRETNLISCLPLLLYGLICFGKPAGGRTWAVLLASGALLFFIVAFSPMLFQNLRFNENLFAVFSQAFSAFSNFFSNTETSLFSLRYFVSHFPGNLKFIFGVVGETGLILILAGIIGHRRRLELWFILILIPLVHLLLFSMFEEDFRRYLVPLLPFLAALGGAGAAVLLSLPETRRNHPGRGGRMMIISGLVGFGLIASSWLQREGFSSLDWRPFIAVIVGVGLILPGTPGKKPFARFLRFWIPVGVLSFLLFIPLVQTGLEKNYFRLSDAERLRREVEEMVPPGAIVWGSRYLIQNIDFYTHAFSLDPRTLSGVFSLSLEDVNRRILDSGIPLFAFDNKGIKTSSGFLDAIGRRFDLEKVKSWKSADLGLDRRNVSRNEWLTLYRVRPWTVEPLELALATPEKVHSLALLNLKNIRLPGKGKNDARLFLEGTEVGKARPGLNYVFLPARRVTPPETVLRIVPRSPMSRNILVGVVPAVPGYCVKLGLDREPEDHLFAEGGLGGDSGRHRLLGEEGRIRIPFYYVKGFQPVLKINLRNNLGKSEPLRLEVSLGVHELGTPAVEARSGWQELEITIPSGLEPQTTVLLKLSALRVRATSSGEEWLPEAGLISLRSVFFKQTPLPAADPAAH